MDPKNTNQAPSSAPTPQPVNPQVKPQVASQPPSSMNMPPTQPAAVDLKSSAPESAPTVDTSSMPTTAPMKKSGMGKMLIGVFVLIDILLIAYIVYRTMM